KNPRVFTEALRLLRREIGDEELDRTLLRFVEQFPPLQVYRGQISAEAYLQGMTEGIPNREIALEEMVMLWLANANPAWSPYLELFDDSDLEKHTAYPQIIARLHEFFEEQPPFGPDSQNLLVMLHEPAEAVPHSIPGQLEYIRQKWGPLLGRFLYRLLGSLDFLKEEEKLGLLGPAPPTVYEYAALEEEPERFTPDRDWMPSLVLIAKSTYVWLDQLSKKYQRPIHRLDQIPDEELDQLARWGFTGLWLIGLWERSRASKKIKQLCGNPEAEASAYSLYDYAIAADLGGYEAYQNLKDRAWARGIRLASDMVPNHTGIDSKWVMEHPDWFIYLDYSPFPGYSFNGPNLSENPRVGIYIEDHYYDRTDAAVVFKRVDFETGDVKYIYHGNDGTSMPWNDTAQLNYLKQEVREAVIQTILHVARLFPIIRFDAAMTLTKKHYQRLWFPEPGTGGDIPSRAEHGLTKEEFDRLMPKEFWREVVDRVAQEAPDTLLLAEAFWLMEGYFVRTLGMHRVYNSAFMNMLKAEKNAEYRQLMKNTLEFDPEILRRFVNFMNNPDEETAVAQFGKGDKYFGVCMMMVTLPGLPMFGHGQIEGFAEKYGMEYRRAYWDEKPDQDLIARHEREIFPLMHKRYLFAGVENFLLYDVFTPEGYVNENVFAYSNRAGDERVLVVYNNRFEHAVGWVRTSVAFSVKDPATGEKHLQQRLLGDGLALHNDSRYFCIFRDHVTGLEFIRSSKELFDRGLFVNLGAYKYQVFLDFREVEDNEWQHYAHLTRYLEGRGVPSIDEALRELFLKPVHQAFRTVLAAERLRTLATAVKLDWASEEGPLRDQIANFFQEVSRYISSDQQIQPLTEEVLALIKNSVLISSSAERKKLSRAKLFSEVQHFLEEWKPDRQELVAVLLAWALISRIGKLSGQEAYEFVSRAWMDEWLFHREISWAFEELGIAPERAQELVQLLRVLINQHRLCDIPARDVQQTAYIALRQILQDADARSWLLVNRYKDILWFNKERFEELCRWILLVSLVQIFAANVSPAQRTNVLGRCYSVVLRWLEAMEKSGFRVDGLLEALTEQSKG
ncbi:MAG TPA: alpha-amylase, partial [Bacteroidetes bacterium]|nr:alpha-amylase [Bacteroidota bacterium]